MQTKPILQITAFLFLVALYSAIFYILGNGMYKETLNDETTMVWSFMAIAGVSVFIALTLFMPKEHEDSL